MHWLVVLGLTYVICCNMLYLNMLAINLVKNQCVIGSCTKTIWLCWCDGLSFCCSSAFPLPFCFLCFRLWQEAWLDSQTQMRHTWLASQAITTPPLKPCHDFTMLPDDFIPVLRVLCQFSPTHSLPRPACLLPLPPGLMSRVLCVFCLKN